eukprot:1138774-Pyramimonas_sp.AAC.1
MTHADRSHQTRIQYRKDRHDMQTLQARPKDHADQQTHHTHTSLIPFRVSLAKGPTICSCEYREGDETKEGGKQTSSGRAPKEERAAGQCRQGRGRGAP